MPRLRPVYVSRRLSGLRIRDRKSETGVICAFRPLRRLSERIQKKGTAMRETRIKELGEMSGRTASLKDPVFIVGLPGVGHVGKFAADFLKNHLKAEPIIDIVSPYFPPQVTVDENSIVSVAKNSICLAETEERSYLFLVGDHQSGDPAGHYELCEIYADIAARFGVKQIYTLGGLPTGVTAEPEIVGAVTDASQKDALKEAGVRFRKSEPSGGIVGASGLVLYFAGERGIPAACLMGTTSGYMADPRSGKALLTVLGKLFGIDIPADALGDKIAEVEKIVEQLQPPENVQKAEEDLAYFG